MDKILRKSGIQLNDVQLDQLWLYHGLLRKRNQDQELTRIIGFEPMVIKHYVDCMIVGKFWQLPSPIVDVGSGAGFPGVPLKIRYPHLRFTLAEPRPKRVTFLNEVIREVKLRQIEVFDHKVVSRSFTKPMKGVITRAVETIDKTLLRTSGCLEKGGQVILLKGPNVDPEIEEVERRFGGEYQLLLNQQYFLPMTSHERRLVIYERMSELKPAMEDVPDIISE
jgi:16S rRNA (guanine527-N7)-methyltransferase